MRWPSGAAFVTATLNWRQGPWPFDWTGPTKRADRVFVCQRKEHTREICCPFSKTIGHEMDTVWITEKHIFSLAFSGSQKA